MVRSSLLPDASPPVITLTTDFGASSAYVAQMKGVLLRAVPHAQLVDVTHAVPPQQIAAGALVLEDTVGWFPDGAVHIAVVDPGVGTERRVIAGRLGRGYCVLPDNGLLTLAADRFGAADVVALDRPEHWLTPTSRTFHGRDIMAPVAAAIAGGRPLAELGTPVDAFVRLELPPVERREASVVGRVLAADSFGNLVTSLRRDHLPTPVGEIACGPLVLRGLVATYGEGQSGEPVALVGSNGRLEIAVVDGSAAAALGIEIGATIEVTRWRRT